MNARCEIRQNSDIQTYMKAQALVAALDSQISRFIQAIIQHPRFQVLERAWRSVAQLMRDLGGAAALTQANIKIKILDVSWAEIHKDQAKALEFDQSLLFRKIYSDAFGTAGGEPFGLMIADYAIRHRCSAAYPYDDMATLSGLAQIGAAAFVPMVFSPAPEFFGVKRFADLGPQVDVKRIFQAPEYGAWRKLREQESSRFLSLVMPTRLLREPYTKVQGITWRQPTGDCALWGSAAFAFAAVVGRAFAQFGWFTQISGTMGDQEAAGLLKSSVQLSSPFDSRPTRARPQVPLVTTDRQAQALVESGFMVLSQFVGSAYCVFHQVNSIFRAPIYETAIATENAQIASRLPNVLCAARFAHFIKVMMRDKVGAFMSAADCEYYLQEWIRAYTNETLPERWESRAKFPLKAAQVCVRETQGRPGHYVSRIHLKPHAQVEQLVAELRLVTELT